MSDVQIVLPPPGRETHSERRPVVVLSSPETNSDSSWKLILVCPISSSTTLKTRFCVRLAAGEANLPKKGWVRVPCVQPIMKDALQDFVGALPEPKLLAVQARLAEYLAFVPEPDPSYGPEGGF